MTDFFADLEREIRAAHPRRPRPVVPVRGIAASAAVAAALVAVVVALGALTSVTGDRAAQQPPVLAEGWTAYAPVECGDPKVVDGRIPEALVDRFAILRADAEPFDLPAGEVPSGVAEVVRQSLRRVSGPGANEYVFAVARLATGDCAPGPHVVCLISIQAERPVCAETESRRPLLVHLTEKLDERRRVVAVLADDAVRRARVTLPERGVVTEFDIDGSTGFQVIPEGTDEPGVSLVE